MTSVPEIVARDGMPLDELLTPGKNNACAVELLVEPKHRPTSDNQVKSESLAQIAADSLIQHDLDKQSNIHEYGHQVLPACARPRAGLLSSRMLSFRSKQTIQNWPARCVTAFVQPKKIHIQKGLLK